ncbi:hypothetical protein BRADI_3g37317v3 [Brachypodium distachyon]|uniref:Uncharacterized protein n=1 Tax=Brachypodium distachyon TaxID=15368 RepID=A0A2K2D1S1_BRADI|nr:hypothetical protein BRADI_3g37317v3 [Brachypodium distachyon]
MLRHQGFAYFLRLRRACRSSCRFAPVGLPRPGRKLPGPAPCKYYVQGPPFVRAIVDVWRCNFAFCPSVFVSISASTQLPNPPSLPTTRTIPECRLPLLPRRFSLPNPNPRFSRKKSPIEARGLVLEQWRSLGHGGRRSWRWTPASSSGPPDGQHAATVDLLDPSMRVLL